MDNLYQQIFKGQAGDTATKPFLEEVVARYPYFSAAHFYLLKATKKNDQAYEQRAALTASHFNNAFYLNFLLNRKGVEMPLPVEEPEAATVIAEPAEVMSTEVIDVAEFKTTEPATKPDTPELSTPEPVQVSANDSALALFEPLYTTDYFLSQGIRLSEDQNPGDKLGKQLRSFTDWLKTMKKLHDGKLPVPSVQAEVAVQKLADKSNIDDEVITEAMAEAYVLQGKKDKAVQVYDKLSLLNPAKNAFFAARIEELKNS